jgi:HK97 family phage major capsid protein
MKTHEIREARAGKVAEMRALLATAETAKRNLNADEQKRFDALKAEVTDLESQEARAAFLEDAERRMVGTPITPERRDAADLEGRVSVLRVLQAQMEGRQLSGAEAEYGAECERRTGRKAEGIFVPMAAFERRANTTSTAGELVGTDHRGDQYIGPLRNALLARRLGVRVLSGLRGDVSIPKHGSGLSVGWVAEGSSVLANDPMSFDSVTLSPKHAGGKAEMSRQLIQQSSPDVEQLVRDDLAFAIAQAIDGALIKGGGSNEPKGILSSIGSNGGVQSASLSTLSWANILGMIEKAELENAPVANWLTSPEVKTKLASTLKASGIAGYLYEGGRMAELPLFSTNQVPTASAGGKLILGDWSQVMLGIWSEVDLLVNPYAEPAYSRGGVLVRIMSTVDIALRHPEAFVVASDINIG